MQARLTQTIRPDDDMSAQVWHLQAAALRRAEGLGRQNWSRTSSTALRGALRAVESVIRSMGEGLPAAEGLDVVANGGDELGADPPDALDEGRGRDVEIGCQGGAIVLLPEVEPSEQRNFVASEGV